MNNGSLLTVLSGPAGGGKDSVVSRLIRNHPEIEVSVSATTRSKRPGEQEGVNYYYLSEEEFRRRIRDGRILEHTCYCGHLYGTPKSEVDRRIGEGIHVILIIETEGAGNIRRLYPDSKLVFVKPPSFEELERRLRGRATESEAEIRKRLERARQEVALEDRYDYVIINDDIDRCSEELYRIIMK